MIISMPTIPVCYALNLALNRLDSVVVIPVSELL